jgi:hypothetical protein
MVGPFLVSVVAMVLLSLAVTAASVVAMVLSLVVTAASVSVPLFEPSLGGAECAVRAQLLEGVAAAKAVTAAFRRKDVEEAKLLGHRRSGRR